MVLECERRGHARTLPILRSGRNHVLRRCGTAQHATFSRTIRNGFRILQPRGRSSCGIAASQADKARRRMGGSSQARARGKLVSRAKPGGMLSNRTPLVRDPTHPGGSYEVDERHSHRISNSRIGIHHPHRLERRLAQAVRCGPSYARRLLRRTGRSPLLREASHSLARRNR